jgi:PKD repeat protein
MNRITKSLSVLIICLSVVCVNSCKPKPKEVLTPEFSVNKKYPDIGDTIRFKNESKNYKKLTWDFGDGTTSEEPNPVHIYKKAGTFSAKIRVDNGKEAKEYATKITVLAANVTIVLPDTIVVGKEILFKTSGSEKYNWKVDSIVVAQNTETIKQIFKKEGSHKVEILNPSTNSSVDLKEIAALPLIAKIEPAKKEPVKTEPAKKTAAIVNFPTTAYTGDMIDYSTNSNDAVVWDFGGKDKSETNAGKISFNEVGKFVVKLIDKASGNVLDAKTINIIEKFDDGRFSSWLTDLANSKLSRSEKTNLSIKVYSYCLNDGEIPVGGMESGSFKDFVRKLMIEANTYETITVTVSSVINPTNKKVTSVQVLKYDKKSNN